VGDTVAPVTSFDDLPGAREFTWLDGDRTVVFREGALADTPALLAAHRWDRYELLTTRRALNDAPLTLASDAVRVHEVPPGKVAEISAGLLDAIGTPTLVALGGGRVIDTAKAIAAVRGGRVAAIPTTLSGAEMTRIHRLPEGHQADRIRPELVIGDPVAMTGLPEDGLRASAMNALAHGAEPLYTPLANPVGSHAALRGAELIATSLDQAPGKRDVTALALGSLLCAYALDAGGYALHHVICQTVVATLGTPHAETNAAVLPHTLAAMRERAPGAIAAFAAALGREPGGLRKRVTALGGGQRRLGDLAPDATRADVDAAIEAIMRRSELALTPDPPGADEIRNLLETAW
jgi:alcohol dehydrogenase class IV